MTDKFVLFISVENAGRSLMAEACFNADPPPGWHAVSAGTRPAAAPNPRTQAMLQEVGLSMPGHPPQGGAHARTHGSGAGPGHDGLSR